MATKIMDDCLALYSFFNLLEEGLSFYIFYYFYVSNELDMIQNLPCGLDWKPFLIFLRKLLVFDLQLLNQENKSLFFKMIARLILLTHVNVCIVAMNIYKNWNQDMLVFILYVQQNIIKLN